MNQRTLGIVTIVVLVVIAIGAVIFVRFSPQKTQISNASKAPTLAQAQTGQKAPEFTAASTAGAFDLKNVDKPVFLEVFATWCPHCQRETAIINRLYQQYNKKVDFIAVSGSDTGMDGTSPSSELDVINYQQKFNVQYPLAYDQSLTVAGLYLKGGFPTIAVIDKNKTISYLNSGEVAYNDLLREVKKVAP
jgi:thiol-disulfide isomerase/thioredoxin